MKISKSYLNKLIKEEYSKIASEGIGPGGSFIGRNASAGRRHPGGYNKFRYTDAQIDLNRMIKSEEFLKQSDFQKLTLLNDFVLKHESDENEKEVVNKAKEALEDVVKRIQRSGSPIGKIVNWLGDKGKKLALDLDGIFEEETTRTKKNIRENNMKITKAALKKLIMEELEEASKERKSSPEVVGVERGVSERLVMIDVAGKLVKISFSASGGSPLVNDVYYEELSDDEREAVMAAAQKAAGMRMASDYSEEDMQTMMSGKHVSPFKP